MNRVKLLYVDDVFDYGGGEQHLLLLIKHLDSTKYAVSVACRKGSVLSEMAKEAGCHIIYIKFSSKFDIFGLISFYRLLKRSNYNIVHLQDNRSHWLGSIAAKLAGVPAKIATVHMVNVCRRINPSKFLRFILATADHIWTSLVDVVITVSDFNKNAMIEEGILKDRINVIYNGIALDDDNVSSSATDIRKELDIGNDSLIVGAVARLSKQKGLSYLLKAAESLIKIFPNMHFVIVGDGPDREKLIEESSKLGIRQKVKFIGFKRNVRDYLRIFDIFTLPSIYEGLPISIIEAMALAKPVIATAVGGTNELVINGKTGFIVQPKDVDGLKKAIEMLINNIELRTTMGQEGKRLAYEKFSINKMAKDTEYLYWNLLRRQNPIIYRSSIK